MGVFSAVARAAFVAAALLAVPVSASTPALPEALSKPITLSVIPPTGFTRNVFAGDKIRQRVFVPSYRVAFMLTASAEAVTTDTRAVVSTVLTGAEPHVVQAIVDRAYRDFVERLTSAGFEVVSTEQWRGTSSASGLQAGKPDIQIKTAQNLGASQSYAIVNATELGAWPETSMPVNLGPVRGITRELDATMVAPRFTVNYAYVQAKGGGRMGFLSRGAQASFTPGIHAANLIAGFGLEAWRVRVGQHGGFMEYKVDGSIAVPGEFGTVATGSGPAVSTTAGGSGVDTWDARLYGSSTQAARARFEADPEAYTRLALEVLALQNQVAVNELAKARR